MIVRNILKHNFEEKVKNFISIDSVVNDRRRMWLTFSLSDDEDIWAPIDSKSLIIRSPEIDAVPANAVMDNMCAAPVFIAYDRCTAVIL